VQSTCYFRRTTVGDFVGDFFFLYLFVFMSLKFSTWIIIIFFYLGRLIIIIIIIIRFIIFEHFNLCKFFLKKTKKKGIQLTMWYFGHNNSLFFLYISFFHFFQYHWIIWPRSADLQLVFSSCQPVTKTPTLLVVLFLFFINCVLFRNPSKV
jgi:hypothetical protein